MKILKYVSLGFLVFFLIFLAIGLFVPTVSYTSQVEVDAPIEHAWKVFTDGDRMGEWIPGVVSSKLIEGEENAIGSVYEMIIESEGERMVMTETVTDYKENETFAFILKADVLETAVDVNFSEENGKTEIVSNNEVKGANLLWKSLFVLTKSTFAAQDQSSYDSLKELIESTEIEVEEEGEEITDDDPEAEEKAEE